MGIEIRRASAADAACISHLNEDVQALHVAAHPELFKPAVPEVFSPEQIAGLMHDPDHFFWLAAEDGQAIGYAYALIWHWPETSFRRAADLISVEQISVRPDRQSQGAGRRLMEAVFALAREKGIPRLMLDVWSFNTRAHDFYERFGFRDLIQRMWLELE